MKSYNSILEISQEYEGFILDVWGVLHASGVPFKGVFESLLALKNQGKKIVLLSNAPRRSLNVKAFLEEKVGVRMGEHYDDILTSGEAFYLEMKAQNEEAEVFYIGPDKDLSVVEGLKLTLTRDFKSNPKFAIVTGIVENSIEILNFLKEKNLLLYCLNPDIFITKSDGSREECAGVIAKKYEEMGGKVIYFGKPFLEVYTKVVPLFDGIDKQKLLAVGDGMETDIEGANKAGIKCVLCLAGLPSIEMNAGVSLADFLVKFKSKPDFIIQSL